MTTNRQDAPILPLFLAKKVFLSHTQLARLLTSQGSASHFLQDVFLVNHERRLHQLHEQRQPVLLVVDELHARNWSLQKFAGERV